MAETTTTDTTTKKGTTLHEKCPTCGYRFPTPKSGCRSKTACAKRAAKRNGTTTAAEGIAAAVNDAVDRLPDTRAKATRKETAPADAGDTVIARTIKTRLDTTPQRKIADAVLPGGDDQLRSGRAGAWLVLVPSEIPAVVAKFDAVVERGGPTASTARAILNRIAKATS